MPITFIDIERRKNRRIGSLFLFLMLMYFCITSLMGLSLVPDPRLISLRFWMFTASTALLVAGIHFYFSAYDAVDRIIRTLDARPPDRKDEVHRRFSNVIQELHVATGNRRRIKCVVIPSLSMNALAAADLRGRAVIGITEGLLSRLTRPRIEAVVAHEAHHILSGDCLEATVAASLFGTLSAAIEKLGRASRGRSFSSPAILAAWVMLGLSHLLNMFISREREFRADAAAVRMTRNPIALAETLHLLSRSWRGAGFIGSGFEMLCIVSPKVSGLDETEGFWSDLLSTHPPLSKRMDILLNMARVSVSELDARSERKTSVTPAGPAGSAYYAMSPRQQWEGPFSLAELGTMPWLSPLTWITAGDMRRVDRAWKNDGINAIFVARLSEQERTTSGIACPACRQPLALITYEGTQAYQCRYCAGTLVENDRVPRIIARTERPCTERINALAAAVVSGNRRGNAKQRLAAGGSKSLAPLIPCPRCKNPMARGFYSLAHLIEIDRCGNCSLTWFDRDELEMLQCIIENKIV